MVLDRNTIQIGNVVLSRNIVMYMIYIIDITGNEEVQNTACMMPYEDNYKCSSHNYAYFAKPCT